MCSEYVTSSESTRMRPGATRLMPRYHVSRSTVSSCGKCCCSLGRKPRQNGSERPTRFSQVLLCDSPSPRRRGGQRRPVERRVEPAVGEAVAALVQGRPDCAEVVGAVARRHADVAQRDPPGERVDGRIEPPRALVEADPAQELLEELLLHGDRIVAVEERVVGRLARGRDDRCQLGAQHVEDRGHLGRLHAGLVLVEERVVRRFAWLHVLRPAQRDVVDTAEGGEEDAVVGGFARLEPGGVGLRALPQQCLAISFGTRRCFSQSRRVTRIRLASSESWSRLSSSGRSSVEQVPDLVGDEALVDAPPSVATASARAGAPAAGIVVRRSHESTPMALSRSSISASRCFARRAPRSSPASYR